MQTRYHSLNELIDMIDEPNKRCCKNIFEDNKELFIDARGSSYKHQNWWGGYLDHLTETMNYATVFYSTLDNLRPLPFSLSDSLLVLYLHDKEKPWRYIKQDDGSWKINPKLVNKEIQVEPFVKQKIKKYGFALSPAHLNALKYVEGEKGDYSQKERVQGILAAFVHLCDNWSARGLYDYPKEHNDPWKGAQRRKYNLE